MACCYLRLRAGAPLLNGQVQQQSFPYKFIIMQVQKIMPTTPIRTIFAFSYYSCSHSFCRSK